MVAMSLWPHFYGPPWRVKLETARRTDTTDPTAYPVNVVGSNESLTSVGIGYVHKDAYVKYPQRDWVTE